MQNPWQVFNHTQTPARRKQCATYLVPPLYCTLFAQIYLNALGQRHQRDHSDPHACECTTPQMLGSGFNQGPPKLQKPPPPPPPRVHVHTHTRAAPSEEHAPEHWYQCDHSDTHARARAHHAQHPRHDLYRPPPIVGRISVPCVCVYAHTRVHVCVCVRVCDCLWNVQKSQKRGAGRHVAATCNIVHSRSLCACMRACARARLLDVGSKHGPHSDAGMLSPHSP